MEAEVSSNELTAVDSSAAALKEEDFGSGEEASTESAVGNDADLLAVDGKVDTNNDNEENPPKNYPEDPLEEIDREQPDGSKGSGEKSVAEPDISNAEPTSNSAATCSLLDQNESSSSSSIDEENEGGTLYMDNTRVEDAVDPIKRLEDGKPAESISENVEVNPIKRLEDRKPAESIPENVSTEDDLDAQHLREMEEIHLGPSAEIIFPPPDTQSQSINDPMKMKVASDWDNLRWMSLSGTRRIAFSRVVFRRFREQGNILGFVKGNPSVSFQSRLLVIYSEPPVLLVLRRAHDLDELSRCVDMDFSDVVKAEDFGAIKKILKQYWIAESALDTHLCKIVLSPITTHYSSQFLPNYRHERELSCFQVTSPVDNVCMSSVQMRSDTKSQGEMSYSDSGAFMETTSTESAIQEAILEAHVANSNSHGSPMSDNELMLFQHHVIQGTLHAIVLSQNTQALQEALNRMWVKLNPTESRGEGSDIASEMRQSLDGAWKALNRAGGTDLPTRVNNDQRQSEQTRSIPSRIIDQEDEKGFTPLYFACRMGTTEAISTLLKYGASLNFQTKESNETLLHVCARTLNHRAIQFLLAVRDDRPRADINTISRESETPMLTALLHGKNAGGQRDAAALESCIAVLQEHGGRLFGPLLEMKQQKEHPLMTLALEQRHYDLEVLINHLHLEFPLKRSMDIAKRRPKHLLPSDGNVKESLAACYGYPIHRLMLNFHDFVKMGELNKARKEGFVCTLRLLLFAGFEANERVDIMAARDSPLEPFVAFAPLQLLARSALHLASIGPRLQQSMYGELDAAISSLAEVLISVGGARISLEAPIALERPRKQTSGRQPTLPVEESTDVDRSSLKIEGSDRLMHLLGGQARLKKSVATFTSLGTVMVDESYAPKRDDSSSIEESTAPGGNSERSCAICWKAFTLLTRKHRCRISWRHLCDECSSKRIVVASKEYRVSDGQFLHCKALVEQGSAKAAEHLPIAVPRSASGIGTDGSSTSNHARVRQKRRDDEDKANRDSLFGGAMMDQATSFLFGGDESLQRQQSQTNPDAQVSGLVDSLGQTRNALLERGQKLNGLQEKTERMVNASEDFAQMATELRKKSQRGIFW